MESLVETYRILIENTDTTFFRFLHSEINWKNRLIAIMGARGVGKTTLLLQHIKRYNDLQNTLFVFADDLYFSEHRLYHTAAEFYKNGGKHFYIDEIHKYSDWSKEIKMMYDHFPDLQIIFTGSSVLELFKGSADLSRRAILYNMPGLSLREYLNMSLEKEFTSKTLNEIITNKVEISGISRPLPLFEQYLQYGYYPFFKEDEYEQRLRNVVNQTLENDIPIYANMNISTSKKLKQLLYIIAQSSPFKPNFTKIGEMIGVHRNQVNDFMFYLEKAGMIIQLRNHTGGIRELGKVEKVYLSNTNLINALAEGKPDKGNLRETFFLSHMNVKHNVTSSPSADFMIDDYTFEVGGKNKNQQQIKGVSNAYLVKDDIEFGYMNSIPLWTFGFNY